MKLDTEMSLVERGLVVARAAVLQGEGGVVAEKINLRDTPVASVAFDPKQTLADRRHQLVAAESSAEAGEVRDALNEDAVCSPA